MAGLNGPADTGADLHWGLAYTNRRYGGGHGSHRRTDRQPGRSQAIRFSFLLSRRLAVTSGRVALLSVCPARFSHRLVHFLGATGQADPGVRVAVGRCRECYEWLTEALRV